MNSEFDNTMPNASNAPRASVDAMISEAMDLELIGDFDAASAVWKIIHEKYPADRETVRAVRQGLIDLRNQPNPTKDFTSAVMVRLAGEDDLDALEVATRAQLEASTQFIADVADVAAFANTASADNALNSPAPRRKSLWHTLTRPRLSATTVAFVLGMCVTTALVVIASKYQRPEERSLAGELAIQRALQLPETPAVVEQPSTIAASRMQPALRLSEGSRYERPWTTGSSQLTLAGGSGAIHARIPIGIATFASPVVLASSEGLATQGAKIVFDPLWRMREQGMGTGVLQPSDQTGVPVGRIEGARIQLDATGMLILPISQ
jgi:hypothetical protein